jgi:hypothetical protein
MVARVSRDAHSDVMPFWRCDSEGVAEEGMYQLSTELDLPDTERLLTDLPAGYGFVFAIFNWEQHRAGGGFASAIETCGTDLVAQAAQSYQRLGLCEEADAIYRVLVQYEATAGDHALLDEAYDAEVNPYRDDWVRIPKAVRVLCREADQLFYANSGT